MYIYTQNNMYISNALIRQFNFWVSVDEMLHVQSWCFSLINIPCSNSAGDKIGFKSRFGVGLLVRKYLLVAPPGIILTKFFFLVLECPSMDYLDAVVSSDKFHRYQKSGENVDYMAELVIHSTPAPVLNEPRYQEFIARSVHNTPSLWAWGVP